MMLGMYLKQQENSFELDKTDDDSPNYKVGPHS